MTVEELIRFLGRLSFGVPIADLHPKVKVQASAEPSIVCYLVATFEMWSGSTGYYMHQPFSKAELDSWTPTIAATKVADVFEKLLAHALRTSVLLDGKLFWP